MLTTVASSNMFGVYLHTFLIFLPTLLAWAGRIFLFVLLVKALRKYLNSGKVTAETVAVRKSLGEALKEHRTKCKMTQEFVAEQLGVSRQAVSKWENGTSDPSTANLLALAKLFGVSPEELLNAAQTDTEPHR